MTVTSGNIERAHRLGRYRPSNNRPIIVNFSSFKIKQDLLSKGFKLKDSGFSVSEDFSANVRYERKQLLEFAREQESNFKLRFNKLIIDGKTFIFDHDAKCVKAKTV